MGTTVKKKNGPTIVELQEVVIGSRLRVSVKVEKEVTEGVFSAMDFTGHDMTCHIKDNTRNDVQPDASFVATPRGSGVGDLGWVDLDIDGSTSGTGALSERDYEASLKVWPTGHEEDAETVVVIKMPVRYRATR
jgi:hypothetical protein